MSPAIRANDVSQQGYQPCAQRDAHRFDSLDESALNKRRYSTACAGTHVHLDPRETLLFSYFGLCQHIARSVTTAAGKLAADDTILVCETE